MTTIKLKEPAKAKKETAYDAGQFFKTSNNKIHVLVRTGANQLGMAAFDPKDAFIRYGEEKLFVASKATLKFINELYDEDYTPISVTISED